jgi:hypothetical protein
MSLFVVFMTFDYINAIILIGAGLQSDTLYDSWTRRMSVSTTIPAVNA